MMKICILQTDILWEDGGGNIRAAEKLLDGNPGADLYVLPEMWGTGFQTHPEADRLRPVAEMCLEWMKAEAVGRNCALAGSLPVAKAAGDAGDKLCWHNVFFFVRPNGQVETYRKRHLFAYGGENRHYAAGHERVVVEYRGVRFLPQICYDLRFPVFSRNRGDYDVALYVANWPESRITAWDTLLRARAIENQCYICGVNRTGCDLSARYCGHSAVIDAYGRVMVGMGGEAGAAMVEIDLDALNKFREKFPVLADADTFEPSW